MLPSPDSKWVAFVDDGILKLGPLPKGPFRQVNGDVANAAFSVDSSMLFFKRRATAGGSLLVTKVADANDKPRKLGDLVGDYRLTPDGKHIAFGSKQSPSSQAFRLFVAETSSLKDTKVADQVFDFKFSPDGKLLARLEGTSPEAGGDFFVGSADGSDGGKKLGSAVRDFAFSPDLKNIAWRQEFVPDRAEGRGTLMVAPIAGGEPKLVGRWCRSYEWAPDSKTIAFTFERTKPLLSVDLFLYKLGDADPVKLKEWAYDYDFTPDSTRLLFRSDCVREGRACNLLSVDVTQPKNPPKKLIEGVYGFRLSQDGSRALFTYARTQGGDLYDTGVLNLKSGEFKTLEQQIRMPPYFLSDDGTKVAYIVAEQKREGVYVADKVP
jgi:Tol biopolymer transport system component